MINRFSRRAKIRVAVAAILLATAVYDTRWGPAPCEATWIGFPIKPKMIVGLTFGFAPWAKAAFPIGTCEADMVAWMDRVGFGRVKKSPSDSHVMDTKQKIARAEERRAKGQFIQKRTLSRKAPIGRSYFTVAWNSDENGRIIEMFADAELMHFFLP